jgi:hypothetical protein
VTNEDIRRYFIKGQPVQHVTVLFRKSVVEAAGGYNEKIKFLFDRDLFLRVAKISKMHNLPDNLVLVGEHQQRFFKYSYVGIDRNWMSTKYQIKAILLFGFSPFLILPVVAKFIYSIFISIKQLATKK